MLHGLFEPDTSRVVRRHLRGSVPFAMLHGLFEPDTPRVVRRHLRRVGPFLQKQWGKQWGW
jgi:hypothetical protein